MATASEILLIILRGELDLASVPQLEAELGRAEAAGTRHVVIDLSHLEFMDSSGLHALIKARGRAVESGRQISLRHPQPTVARLLQMTGIDRLFPTDETAGEAAGTEHVDVQLAAPGPADDPFGNGPLGDRPVGNGPLGDGPLGDRPPGDGPAGAPPA